MMMLAMMLACGLSTSTLDDTAEVDSDSTGDGTWAYDTFPTTLDFGPQTLGSTVSEVLTVRNLGQTDLLILDLQAPEAQGVSITAPDSVLVQAGSMTNLVVTWSPQEVGAMEGAITLTVGPSPTESETVSVPVTGQSQGAAVVISTMEYDFGDINVGCKDELTVTVTNTGNEALTVDSVHINGDETFEADPGDTSFPTSLEPFQSLGVDITYSPVNAEFDQAYLEIKTGADTVAAAISGTGAVDGEASVTYEVGVLARATTLWHVNEVALVGSAGYYNEVFYASMPHYFEQLQETRAYYRIAFLWNTDGSIEGDTPYIDHTMSASEAWTVAQQMMATGASIGDNDRNFTSLIAGLSAQSDWLFEDEYWEESKLSLITVQRDVEQSGGNYIDYVNQARAFKDDDELLVFHAIAGPPPQGCGGYAEYFSGYYEAVVETDGVFLSVCETNWDAHMEQLIAASIGGGGDFFPLTGNPLESSIEVFIDDIRASEGWEYDADLNSVIFEEDHYPDEGSEVTIDFIKATGCG